MYIVHECVQGSGLTARAPTRRVACACTSAADLQANASAADLSVTRWFDVSKILELTGQGVLLLTGPTGCPTEDGAQGQARVLLLTGPTGCPYHN